MKYEVILDVDMGRAIAGPVPTGWRVIGTVRAYDPTHHRYSALVETQSGKYVAMNAGIVNTVPQRAVIKAMGIDEQFNALADICAGALGIDMRRE